MQSFREEIARLTAKHFSPKVIKEQTTKLARELERLIILDAPATRDVSPTHGRRQSGPTSWFGALGGRFSRNLERLTMRSPSRLL